ncbi:hypothetical protein DFH28DRAFT_927736 [Melampsora americana]|nr:hypothetical protein DFH28DRAFT_927736 [Melampsora americana]
MLFRLPNPLLTVKNMHQKPNQHISSACDLLQSSMTLSFITSLVLWTVHICQMKFTVATGHLPVGFMQGFNDGLPALSNLEHVNFPLDFNSQPHHIQGSINGVTQQDAFGFHNSLVEGNDIGLEMIDEYLSHEDQDLGQKYLAHSMYHGQEGDTSIYSAYNGDGQPYQHNVDTVDPMAYTPVRLTEISTYHDVSEGLKDVGHSKSPSTYDFRQNLHPDSFSENLFGHDEMMVEWTPPLQCHNINWNTNVQPIETFLSHSNEHLNVGKENSDPQASMFHLKSLNPELSGDHYYDTQGVHSHPFTNPLSSLQHSHIGIPEHIPLSLPQGLQSSNELYHQTTGNYLHSESLNLESPRTHFLDNQEDHLSISIDSLLWPESFQQGSPTCSQIFMPEPNAMYSETTGNVLSSESSNAGFPLGSHLSYQELQSAFLKDSLSKSQSSPEDLQRRLLKLIPEGSQAQNELYSGFQSNHEHTACYKNSIPTNTIDLDSEIPISSSIQPGGSLSAQTGFKQIRDETSTSHLTIASHSSDIGKRERKDSHATSSPIENPEMQLMHYTSKSAIRYHNVMPKYAKVPQVRLLQKLKNIGKDCLENHSDLKIKIENWFFTIIHRDKEEPQIGKVLRFAHRGILWAFIGALRVLGDESTEQSDFGSTLEDGWNFFKSILSSWSDVNFPENLCGTSSKLLGTYPEELFSHLKAIRRIDYINLSFVEELFHRWNEERKQVFFLGRFSKSDEKKVNRYLKIDKK